MAVVPPSTSARTEAGGGFFQEQHRRREDQLGSQVESPAHAARVLAYGLGTGAGEAELGE
jgi:hypothetical protein